MAKTTSADLILPSNFADYVAVNSTVKTPLWQSGVVQNAADVSIAKGGKTVIMPFLNDLTGDAEILSETTPLTVNKVTAASQTAAVNARGKLWGANDLASAFSGTDIVGHIGNRISTFWERSFQNHMVATLTGAVTNTEFAATSVLDISAQANAAAVFSTEGFIDAEHLLGDARGSLGVVAVHSAVVAKMKKLNLVDVVQDSNGGNITTYRGYRLIEMDTLSPASGVYTMYLLGAGAFGYAEGPTLHAYETQRDIAQGDTLISGRRAYALHLMGLSWVGTPAGATPTNAELATGTNWDVVLDPKLIPAAAFKFKLA
jgi:hypothetical protein